MFVIMNQIKEGQGAYSEDTGEYENEKTIPSAVNLAALRTFTPRHGDKPGTRLTFTDGGGYPVTAAFDEVLAAVAEYQSKPLKVVGQAAVTQLEQTH